MRDLADELLQAKVKTQLFGGEHSPRVGRLVILDRIGSGAMGTVFAAYDPRLERKVAVKLLRASGDANARVLAEARALAKLAHPNVVAVYDVGELDGAVHIVMELAPGVPLRAWIGGNHPWQAVVRVMRDAGEGIAAAHRAGLVHRDIKPDNILIGEDRTRVVDFGLAYERAGDQAASAGTPSYMAPEVLAGGVSTDASDQFSFGVTLYEALHGKRPYSGKTRDELCAASATAAQARPAEDSAVPAWIQQIVARALAADPNDRFPSMTDLLAALGRDRKRTRVAAIVAAALVAGGAIGAIVYRSHTSGDPCSGGAERRSAVWPETGEPRSKIRAALAGVPWAAATLDGLTETATRWEASYRKVCEATRVRGDQSDTLLDLRMRCLGRALDRFGALVTALGQADALDASARIAAPSAIAELPSPEACETLVDPGELAMPTDSMQRARVEAAEHDLDRAWVTFGLGRYKAARAIRDAIPNDLDAPVVQAQLLALSASIESRIGDPSNARSLIEQALTAAAAAHAPQLELDAWSRALRGELFAGNPAHVIEWAPFARAAAARVGHDSAELDGIVAEALRDNGELGPARELLEHALATQQPLRADQRALLELNLGAVELAEADSADALATLQRAYERVRATRGYGHPELALYLDKLGAANRARDKIREALAQHDKSLELRIAAFGPEDRSVATSLLHRGQTKLEAGDPDGARDDFEHALEIRNAVFGANSPRIGEITAALGDVAAALDLSATAQPIYERARALDPRLDLTAREIAAGSAVALDSIKPLAATEALSIDRAAALAARVTMLVAAGRADEAHALANALHARYRATLDPALTNAIAAALFAVGERDAAATLYGAAVARHGNEPTRTALASFIGLARAADGPRAAQAARTAIALYQAMPKLARGDYPAMEAIANR